MASYESASVHTDNEEVFKQLKKHFIDKENYFGFGEVTEDKHIALRNRHGNTVNDLLKFSSLHENVYLFAEVSYEAERYGRTHKYTVNNGKYQVTEIIDHYEDDEPEDDGSFYYTYEGYIYREMANGDIDKIASVDDPLYAGDAATDDYFFDDDITYDDCELPF